MLTSSTRFPTRQCKDGKGDDPEEKSKSGKDRKEIDGEGRGHADAGSWDRPAEAIEHHEQERQNSVRGIDGVGPNFPLDRAEEKGRDDQEVVPGQSSKRAGASSKGKHGPPARGLRRRRMPRPACSSGSAARSRWTKSMPNPSRCGPSWAVNRCQRFQRPAKRK